MDVSRLDTAQLCGQLIVGGFDGTTLTPSYADALATGRRGGAILFARNIDNVEQLTQLNRAIIDAAGELVPFVGVDQEGGRVARLRAPFIALPPMRALAAADDLSLTHDAAAQVARELAAVGFNIDFAPVMDVDSNPDNPIIGDRAFGADPRSVMRHGVAWLRGLQSEDVLACAKHFPGHGDTALDSHLALPTVDRPRQRLDAIELPPFRAAAGAGVASMMSAHVVYPALDANVPATFSRAICTDILRHQIGFEGVLFSDDLEMGAIAQHHDIEHAAVSAVEAGCDVLLICKDEALQERAHAALCARFDFDATFAQRCRVAASRAFGLRQLCPPHVAGDGVIGDLLAGEQATALRQRIDAALGLDPRAGQV
jgi:beta-N-acetylhexosaminidase